MARRPPRSMTLVDGPLVAMMSAASPTAEKRPPVIATAWGAGFDRSSVVNLPLIRIRSGVAVWPMAGVLIRAVRPSAVAPAMMSRRLGSVMLRSSPWVRYWVGMAGAGPAGGQTTEDVLAAMLAERRHGDGLSAQHPFCQRRDLLADQDAEQPDQGYHRRRRGAHVQQAVEDADQEPDGESYDIGFHGKTSRHGKERAAPAYSAASLFAATGSRRWPCLTRSGALWTIV